LRVEGWILGPVAGRARWTVKSGKAFAILATASFVCVASQPLPPPMSTYGYIVPLAIDLPHQSIARSPLGEMHVDVAYEELPPEHTGIARDQPKWGVTPPASPPSLLRRIVDSAELPSHPGSRLGGWRRSCFTG
jgi:hypothetical protein